MGNKDQLVNSIRKSGIRELRKNIIKSAIFYAVSIVCLFLIESSNELLSRKDNPVVFWSIFVLVILIPIIRFRFYRLFFYCEYGEVTEIKNKRELGAKNKENERATAMYGDITMMGTIEVCVITVRTRRGTYREYTFSRDEMANFARASYQVGDTVFCPLFAKYPYNEMREPSRPFCLFCGELGEADSQVCKKCGGELWKKI